MDKKLVLLLFLGFHMSSFLPGQEVGQQLYVATKNGLTLRKGPSLNSPVLGVLRLNDSLRVNAIAQADVIDMRVSNWVECIIADGTKGYLFAGYLNQYPLPTEQYASLRDYIHEYVKTNFLELSASKYVDDHPGDMYDKTTYVSWGDNYTIKGVDEWEYRDTEFIFSEVNLAEIINLIEYAVLHGEKLEYGLLREAFLQQQDLSLFVYRHAISDPPEGTIILEAIYPSGVRIRIFGGG